MRDTLIDLPWFAAPETDDLVAVVVCDELFVVVVVEVVVVVFVDHSGISFNYILRAAFAPIFFFQKITKPNRY